jgi:TonB-linked SusC/RagA family outer membrane protein
MNARHLRVLIALLLLSHLAFAQKSVSVREALKKVTKTFGTQFVYDKQLLEGKKTTYNLDDIKSKSVEDVLKGILYPNNLVFLYVKPDYYTIVSKDRVGAENQAAPATTNQPVINNANNIISSADKIKITGSVTDSSGKGIPDATITEMGFKNSTATNSDGSFVMNVSSTKSILVISSVGYAQKEIEIGNQNVLSVSLQQVSAALAEVVVIGYGTQKRSDLTGSITTLSSKSYKDQPVLNASSALQGRVAGVSVTNNSGAPGGGVKIRIRGANSVNASNDPLYVIDGIALSSIGLSDINVNDIESMEILKDASATAVYGSRGANGVILITTKSGKSGDAKIEYNGFTSFNKPMKKYDLMDAVTYAKVANVTAGVDVFPDPNSFAGKSTDWQNLIFDNSVSQSHQLSLTGGTENARYYVSGFYIDQEGLLINSSQKKFGIRSNLDLKLSKRINFGLNFYGGRINSNNNGDIGGKGNPVTAALTWAPTEPVYDAPGQYNRFGISPIWVSPYLVIKERVNENFSNVGVFNAKLKYTITDWLTLNINAGLDMNISKSAYLNNEWISPGNNGSGQSSSENYTWQNSNILTFHKKFNKHDLSATALMEATANKYYAYSALGSGLASLSNGYYNLGLNASQSISSGYSNWSLLSYMGRMSYSYNDKYLLTATIRRDGSSKFQGANRWSNFPSFSAGWKLSNEKFISDLNLFSNLKLRAGWGITGNQAVGPYSTLGLLTPVIYSYGTSTVYPGYTLGNPATPDVKWETSKQLNVGLDAGLFNNRLNITADYYNKNTSDLLLFTKIANYNGGGSYLKNIGKVNNKGWELMIEGTPYNRGGFTWSTSFNVSVNQNKVVSLGNDSMLQRPNIGGGLTTTNVQVVKVGQPLGAFYLIPWEGVYQESKGNYMAGDAKYTDVSGNNSIVF